MSFWNKTEKPLFDPLPASGPPSRAEPLPPPAVPSDRLAAPPPGAPSLIDRPAALPVTAPPPPAPAEAPRGNHLRLGRGVRLEGKLTFSGTVRIDATFQGSIVTDGVLVLGEDSTVNAEISCGTVVIEGELRGNVVAREAVELRRSAILHGDVETPSLAIERGALFEGASRRPAGMASTSSGKAAAAPAPSAH
jgi:cytoskeletal protein CcmA (bactofilin family)